MKILITGCGRHSKGLVKCLKNNPDREPIEVIGINNNPQNILRSEVDEYVIAPSINDTGYIDWLLIFCKEKNVDVVLPYITAELPILAKNKEYLESEGTRISVSSLHSLSVANNKNQLHKMFPGYMPEQITTSNKYAIMAFAEKMGYYDGKGLCCKLTDKCGGAGFSILDEEKRLDIARVNKVGEPHYIGIELLCEIVEKTGVEVIVQEYVPGTDYSVCVLADHGRTVYECGFAGYAMEFGAVTSGEIIKNQKAYSIAEEVVGKIGIDGNACFDFIIKDDGSPVLLECNPRINASLPFLANAGANLAYYRCCQLIGRLIPDNLDVNYGLKMAKYYEEHYYK